MRTKAYFLLRIVCIRHTVRVHGSPAKLFVYHPISLFVCARPNSRKYSSNAFKLLHDIQIY